MPIDFSTASICALRHAVGLAEQQNAHITLLNVIEEVPSFRRLDAAGEQHEILHRHTVQLREIAERECGDKITVRTLVRDGFPAREIERAAAEQHADLIVVGRHQRRGFKRIFSGHTAIRVTRSAKCPVMVLNEAEVEVRRPAGHRQTKEAL